MRRGPLLTPALLSTALLLAACGGGEDEKAAYVDRANAVCEKAQADVKALKQPSTPEAFAPYADELVGLLEEAQTELSALTPPAGDRAELERRVLKPFSALVEQGKDFAGQVRAADGDQSKLLGLLSKRPTAKAIDTEYLREYGIETCADAIEASG
jgi:Tfp pilus assembly protein PilP